MTSEAAPAVTPRWRTAAAVGVVAVVVAGLVLRWFILTHALGSLDGDEATTGLVARHLLHNHEHPVFYWASNYGGTLEAAVTAAVFAVTGSSVLVLKLVSAVWFAAAAVLTWRVGRRLVDERVGAVAGLLFWVWPATYVWWSTKSRGFYGSVLVLGLVVALTALRVAERPERTLDWLVLGLAAGVGWWDQPQIVTLVVPVGLWLLLRNWRALGRAWIAVPAAVIGAAPWLLWNVRNHWASFDVPPQPTSAPYATRLARFWTEGIPMATGLRVPYVMRWVAPGARVLFPFLLVAVAGLAVARFRRAGAVVVGSVVVYSLVYALNPLAVGSVDGRYVLLVAPILVTLLACVVAWRWVTAPVLAVAVALSALGLSAMHDGNSFFSSDKPIPAKLGPLLRVLRDENAHTAVADYGIAYRIDFESDEQIIAAGAPYNRYQGYADAVAAGPPPAWVFVAGSAADARFRAAMDAAHEPYRARSAGGFAVYLPAHKLLPGQMPSG